MTIESGSRPGAGFPTLLAVACVAILSGSLAASAARAVTDDTPEEPSATPAATTAPAAEGERGEATPAGGQAAPAWNRRREAPGGVDGQLFYLAHDLKLDAGQQDRIRPILVAQRNEQLRLRGDATLKQADRQRRLLALGDRSADAIRAQLTDEQREQYIKPRSTSVATPATPPRRRTAGTPPSGNPPARKEKP